MTDNARSAHKIIPAEVLDGCLATIRACILRMAASQAPETRALGAELQERYLDLAGEVRRHELLVDLWGWEREPPEPEPLPVAVPHLVPMQAETSA